MNLKIMDVQWVVEAEALHKGKRRGFLLFYEPFDGTLRELHISQYRKHWGAAIPHAENCPFFLPARFGCD